METEAMKKRRDTLTVTFQDSRNSSNVNLLKDKESTAKSQTLLLDNLPKLPVGGVARAQSF